MAILTRDVFDIIKQTSVTESVDSASSALLEQELEDELNATKIIPDDVNLDINEASVRLFKDSDENYYIEYSEVIKLAEAKGCDEIKAMEDIADYYSEANITAKNLFLVIESEDFFSEKMSDAKSNEKMQRVVKESIDTIKELKSKGVQIIRKK